MQTIKEMVSERLAQDVPVVKNRVIDLLTEQEIKKRVDAVVAVITKLDETKKEFYKLKPDNVVFDIDGNVLTEGYTKATLENRKKKAEQVAKLEKALDQAFDDEKPNFEQVLKIASGKDDGNNS